MHGLQKKTSAFGKLGGGWGPKMGRWTKESENNLRVILAWKYLAHLAETKQLVWRQNIYIEILLDYSFV